MNKPGQPLVHVTMYRNKRIYACARNYSTWFCGVCGADITPEPHTDDTCLCGAVVAEAF
jgi:hypothetical protein